MGEVGDRKYMNGDWWIRGEEEEEFITSHEIGLFCWPVSAQSVSLQRGFPGLRCAFGL